MADHTIYEARQFDAKFSSLMGIMRDEDSDILVTLLLSVTELSALPNVSGDHSVTFSFQDDEDNLVMTALLNLVKNSIQFDDSLHISVEHYTKKDRKLSRSHILERPRIKNIRSSPHDYLPPRGSVERGILYLDITYKSFKVVNHTV